MAVSAHNYNEAELNTDCRAINNMMQKRKIVIIIIITIILFIVSSFLSNKYAVVIKDFLPLQGVWGEIIYILVMTAAVIVAPFETLPLLPIAVTLWGANLAAVFTIIGWLVGALIAFNLSRYYGRKFVCRFISKCDIDEWEEKFPKKDIFWLVVLARFVLPVDIISYVVGLFTNMHWLSYLLATFLGVVPFAFIFAYGAKLPLIFQLGAGLVILGIIIFGYHNIRQSFSLDTKDKESGI